MRNALLVLGLLVSFIFLPPKIYAQDRFSAKNPSEEGFSANNLHDDRFSANKLGIHLAVPSEEDLQDAASLINSTGGDWGYVTLVLQEGDRNREKWQRTFDQMRELHLIPIVRLATTPIGDAWRKPETKDIQPWVDFLGSLNWVVKNRYLVLFNEPNFSKEWGNKVDPEDYADLTLRFSQALKENNQDYFVMMAGLNATAPHSLPTYESEQVFLQKIVGDKDINEVFKNIDGWASHSYETNIYIRELNLLGQMGFTRPLPVFITEAGWPHAQGLSFRPDLSSEDYVAQSLLSYFNQVMGDSRVVAITPFVLNYQSEPFDHFSWRMPGSKEFYSQFQTTQSMAKVKGNPLQEQKLVLTQSLPGKLIADSTYQIPLKIENLGQAIWSKGEGYSLQFSKEQKNFEYFFSDLNKLLPFNDETVWLYLKTKDQVGKMDISLGVAKNGKMVSNLVSWPLELLAPLKISIKIDALPLRMVAGNDLKVLIYNDKEEMVYAMTGIPVRGGRGELSNVNNLIVGEKYRVVAVRPYYLPRQTFLKLAERGNKVTFKPMLPLDFNQDGNFSLDDLKILFREPQLFRHLLW